MILVFCKPWRDDRNEDSNLDNESTAVLVQHYLQKAGHSFVMANEITKEVNPKEIELVITVGGDGTLLRASHFIGPNLPVLAINSAPDHSEGYFCGASRRSLKHLEEALGNWSNLRAKDVSRMCVAVNGTMLTKRVLNDVLFCHDNPAMTSRYAFHTTDDEPEFHRSSGMWFSTAVGSTAAIRSAGGFTSPHDSENVQYLVREPFQPSGKRLQNVHGFIEPGQTCFVTSMIDDGRVYVDGAYGNYRVGNDDQLQVFRSPEPLRLLNFREKSYGQ